MRYRGWGNRGPRVAPQDGRPAFFKILLPGIAIDRLRIPPAFTTHISNDLQENAKLRGPSAGWWDIKLGQIDGMIYIQDGWKQFLDDNSLGDYEFLLFRYNGGLCFDVQIFDKSGCERIPKCLKEEECQHQKTESKRKRGRPRKKQESSTHTEGPVEARVKIEEDETACLDTEETISLRCIDSFASVFPYFKCIMTANCVEKRFIVTIPAEFSKEHFPETTEMIQTRFSNTEGEEWEVRVICNKQRKRMISGGWSLFVRDNHIKVHNVCVFELIDGINLIRVHVFDDF